MIERVALKNFTVFDGIKVWFSPRVNVVIGENATGKTHLLKAAHVLSSSGSLKKGSESFFDARLQGMLLRFFMPLDGQLNGLRKWGTEGKSVMAADFSAGRRVTAAFSAGAKTISVLDNNFPKQYQDNPVYIPSREVLSFMKGFGSLYERYELSFDQSFQDICLLLDLPKIRTDNLEPHTQRVMDVIEKICSGRFVFHGGGRVSFESEGATYPASMAAEGFLLLGMFYRLLENGTIRPGESGPIFWDQPEAGLNPKLLKVVAWILLELSRNGQQVVLATHSYVLLKYFDLLKDRSKGDEVRFHSLYRDDRETVGIESVDDFNHLARNAISETYLNLYDTEIERVQGKGKN